MKTVVDVISQQRGGQGTLTVLDATGIGYPIAWSLVHERARRLGTVLARRGVGHGCRVGLLGETSADLVTALQAVWLTGAAISVLALPAHNTEDNYSDQLRRVVVDARLTLVVVGNSLRTFGRLVDAWIPTVALADLVAEATTAEQIMVSPPAPDELAILQYTSGSTRQPRGVPVTHGQLAANLTAIQAATRHSQVHGCMLSWLPLYHDMGLVGFLALPMACGCPLVLQSPAGFASRPLGWLEALATHHATVTAAPNFAWELATRLLAARRAPDPSVRLDSLRFALTGGEPVNATAMERFLSVAADHGLDPSVFTCGYGLAEATLAVTFPASGVGLQVDVVDPVMLEQRGVAAPVPDAGGGRTLIRQGRPVPGTRLRIVDRVEARLLGEREVGHIEVAGPSVVAGYWGEEPAPDGRWLRTGDLGYLAEGELVVCGRDKDVLFAAGRNIFPQDVEAAVGEVPTVRSGGVAAFAVPGGDTGDRLVVAAECRPAGDEEQAVARTSAIRAAVTAEVGLTAHAIVVLPPGRLPRTSSGKLRRAETRRQYLTGQFDLTRTA